jgi:lauroyl/myristoyl acyltransferase
MILAKFAWTKGGRMAESDRTTTAQDDIPVAQDDEIRAAGLPARIYGSQLMHRLLPASVALALVSRVGPAMRQRRNQAERRDAELFMSQLLAHTPRAGEAPELGGRWLAEKSRIGELFWRPWLIRSSSSVEGLEHWHAARAGGRGAVLVFGHILATWSVPAILGAAGLRAYIVLGPHYYEPMPAGYPGIALLHRRRAYGEKALGLDHVVVSTGRPERLKELVEAGEVVAIAYDAPGRAPTPFLGRTVGFGGAATRLALETGCKVLPAVPERHGTRLVLRFYPPIDAAEHTDSGSLRTAIAGAFEPIVLARPEEIELAWNPSPLITEVQAKTTSDVKS